MTKLKQYRPINCSDCGIQVQPTSGNFKRCSPCQMKSRGMTGRGYTEKTCERCSSEYKPNATGQKFCDACRPIARTEANMRRLEAARRKAGAIEIGTVRPCSDCGLPYSFKAGPQHRCKPCQIKENRRMAIEATKRSPLRAEYRKRTKATRAFGGNKDAVLERDESKCRKCCATEKLCVHHIDGLGKGVPRDAQNHAMENLITLCGPCHQRLHAITDKLLFVRHPETVQEALAMFMEG